MRFCSACGGALEPRVPEGDDRERPVCTACGKVAYSNPRTVVGCIVEHGERLLLCRRGIEPAVGRWTPPAGFLELDEGAMEGARRETREEAEAEVEILAPHAFLCVPGIGQTYALFRARLRGEAFGAGPESLETALFDVDALPWAEIAFPVMHEALRLWVDDRRSGRPHVHHGVMRKVGEGERFDPANYVLEDHVSVPIEAP